MKITDFYEKHRTLINYILIGLTLVSECVLLYYTLHGKLNERVNLYILGIHLVGGKSNFILKTR